MKRSHDVVVVGAGPAGATLAYQLAKRAIDVLVLEKEKLPRYKCCAGGVSRKAARLLDFDISEVVEDAIFEVAISFDLSSPYLGQHSEPLVYTVVRDLFDYFLVKKAQELGAVFMEAQKVRQIRVSGDWFEISTSDSIFRARLVVGADGAYSVVARELGMERNVECVVGMESEVTVPKEELARWKSRLQMDLGCVPGGYAWIFPKRNHLSIGVGCVASKAKRLKHYNQKFLNSIGMQNCAITKRSSHLIPTCTKGSLVWQNKALLVGDAAGLADPLTGEGIYNAILSAQLAAPVIERSLAHSKVGLEAYQEAVNEKIMPDLRTARVLSRLFIRFPRLAFRMLWQGNGVWRAGCALMSGELKYTDIKKGAGGFRGIVSRLFRT